MSGGPGKVFIVGATGDTGARVVTRLQNANIPVRISSSRESKVEKLKADGVDAVCADLSQSTASLAGCIKGCETFFLISPATPHQLEQNQRAIDAAVLAGCSWIVRISAADAREDCNVPWVRAHFFADRYLERVANENGIKWTVLSPSAYMSNVLSEAGAVQKGFLPQSCGEGKACWIDTEDVAQTCYQVLKDGPRKHTGQTYILTGPQELSFSDIAQSISKGIGHHVRYIDLPGPVFKLLLRLGGADAWTADGLVAQFNEIIRPGKEWVEINDVVEKITGRPPTSFEHFARTNAEALRGRDILPLMTMGGLATTVVAVGLVMLRS